MAWCQADSGGARARPGGPVAQREVVPARTKQGQIRSLLKSADALVDILGFPGMVAAVSGKEGKPTVGFEPTTPGLQNQVINTLSLARINNLHNSKERTWRTTWRLFSNAIPN